MSGDAVELRCPDRVGKVLSGEKVETVAGLQRAHPQTDAEMRFPDAWWPEEDRIDDALHEAGRLQLVDHAPVERGLRVEVERVQRPDRWEVRQLRASDEAALVAVGELITQEMVEELHVRELPFARGPGDGRECSRQYASGGR